ncbi:hypothetical protein Pyn_18840 [Prunus yedoensis var. nudiflora]|uniref:Uncharacterized protein n=1 Tax=Prunus yedoensis var. nudiflora TaxID=2094558 RepID=A0A314XWU2_PRUYE|nr:hypothetical protein Pyn_18840 [Prunus yedoensis var. nudiflora]
MVRSVSEIMALLRPPKKSTPPSRDPVEPPQLMIESSLYSIVSDYKDREYFNCMMSDILDAGTEGDEKGQILGIAEHHGIQTTKSPNRQRMEGEEEAKEEECESDYMLLLVKEAGTRGKKEKEVGPVV